MPRKVVVVTAAALFGIGMLPVHAATKTVEIPARRFDPARITIFVGDTIRWISTDNERHTVTANTSAVARGESFDSSENCPGFPFSDCLRRGDSFAHAFTTAGTFTYRCKIHGSDTAFANCAMCGQVIVKERTVSSPPATTSPASPRSTPSTPGSPTPTGSVTTSPTASVSPTGPPASPPGDGDVPIVPIAGAAVLLLGGSGILVYRTLLRR